MKSNHNRRLWARTRCAPEVGDSGDSVRLEAAKSIDHHKQTLILNNQLKQQVATRRSSRREAQISWSHLTLLLIVLQLACQRFTSAQFLFTYEINQEDDSRAPKSSLFDPSAFKIVTPSQLQSSYQKISSQLDSQVATGQVPTTTSQSASSIGSAAPTSGLSGFGGLGDSSVPVAPPPPPPPQQQQQAALPVGSRPTGALSLGQQQPASAQSLLKQTTAALHSFAELFNFGGQSTGANQSPVSSPSPLGPLTSSANNQQPVNLDQQAEARSLHEHWLAQQQKSHTNSALDGHPSALQSFTTSLPGANLIQHPVAQPQSPRTQPVTASSQQQQQQGQEAPQASYWLTASPLNAPDGNFLVEIKQPNQQQQQQQQPPQAEAPTPPSAIVDSLLSLGQRAQQSSQLPLQRPHQSAATQPAQSSFLATPTSYYPMPTVTGEGSPMTSNSQPQQGARDRFSFVPAQHQSAVTHPSIGRPQGPTFHLSHRQRHQQPAQESPIDSAAPLQPPANAPENFVAPHIGNNHLLGHHHQPRSQPRQVGATQQSVPVHLKSAEESLNAFRQQQQSSAFSGQPRPTHQQQQQQQGHRQLAPQQVGAAIDLGDQHYREPVNLPAPQRAPASSANSNHLGEIPKVSPQIYESFLLQQRDQHEKHMELLKQQQELNKLLEQKQKQEASEAKRKRKKEELERNEARAKKQREQEEAAAARKLKLEQEERARRRQHQLEQEEAERKRVAEEARRYREFLEARERERQEEEAKKERELAEQRRRKAEADEREARARIERELAERRRLEAERAAAEAAEAKRKRDDEAKLVSYLRQQEELKKLLELKQKEDEALNQRRRLAAAQHQQQQQQAARTDATRANRLANAEHRDRSHSSHLRTGATFGARGRALAPAPTSTPLPLQTPSSPTPTSDPLSGPLTSGAPTSAASLLADSAPSTVISEISATTATSASLASPSTSAQPAPRAHNERLTGALRRQRVQSLDEKLIRQKIPLYSGAGKYGLYRNESLSQDLAALLASVTLPPTSSTTSTTPAPAADSGSAAPTTNGSDQSDSSHNPPTTSLSPLLARARIGRPLQSRRFGSPSAASATSSRSDSADAPLFDDDVPRRPARGLISGAARAVSAAASSVVASTQPKLPPRLPVVQPTPTPTPPATTQRARVSSNATSTARVGGATRPTARIGLGSLPSDSDNDGIPGRAGVEYPVLSAVPPTSFSCAKQPLNGYYADTETACQVVHLCQGGVQSSILCPNGTIFNQEKFSCQWWYEVNCSRAPIFYQLNDNLYKSANLSASAAPASRALLLDANDNENDDDDDSDDRDDATTGSATPKPRKSVTAPTSAKQKRKLARGAGASSNLL